MKNLGKRASSKHLKRKMKADKKKKQKRIDHNLKLNGMGKTAIYNRSKAKIEGVEREKIDEARKKADLAIMGG